MTRELNINGKTHNVDVSEDTPLLWVLRDTLQMTGTKYGCGIAQCGACTVEIDGRATRTCILPIAAVNANQKITTIEGLSKDTDHVLQKAWIEEDVAQCGYCQSGMLMAASALLKNNTNPSDAQINSTMSNICRCGTYQKVRAAIKRAAKEMQNG